MSLLDIERGRSNYLKGRTPDETVVVGAGLSKMCGFPLATELLPRLLVWGREIAASQVRPLLDFLDYFYPGWELDSACPSAEDVLGMIDAAEEYSLVRSSRNRGFKWRPERARQLRDRFCTLLARYLWELHVKLEREGFRDLQPLREFVRTRPGRTTFISFNYDLLLETALTLEGRDFAYHLQAEQPAVAVLKPHGSINWCLTVPKRGAGPRQWAHLGESISAFRGCTGATIPFEPARWPHVAIVAPTPNKRFRDSSVFRQVWTAFSSSVHSARKLTVVGYSLPEADRISRVVLNRAGPRHSGSRQITVVDPADVERIYRLCVSPTCRFVRKPFLDYVSELH